MGMRWGKPPVKQINKNYTLLYQHEEMIRGILDTDSDNWPPHKYFSTVEILSIYIFIYAMFCTFT